MARTGRELESFLRGCADVQVGYPSTTDEKKACLSTALSMFRGRGEVLDIGYEEWCGDVYRSLGHTPVGFNLPKDMHFDLDGKWERILCRHVLEHSLCPAWVLKCMHDVLVDGGECVVVVPNVSKFMAEHDGHFSVLHDSGWRKLFGLVGFRVECASSGSWAPHDAYVETRYKLVKVK